MAAPIRQMVILAGGRGTRLGSHTQSTPKPLMQIAPGKVFLDYLVENVARQGFQDILIVAGHFGDQIAGRYHNARIGDADISVFVEPEARGTGGALTFIRDHLAGAFLVTNGDTYFDGNFRAAAASLRTSPSYEGVIVLREVEDVGRYGSVVIGADRLVNTFLEKDPTLMGHRGLINAGTYALRRTVLDRIKSLPVSIESDVFPAMAAEGRLGSVSCDGYFIDIGLPETLETARSVLPHRKRPVLFLDRDGVLNHDINYLHKRDQWQWIDGAIDTIKMANDLGVAVVVVTNQAGVARGYYSEADLKSLHATINEELKSGGAFVDAFFYCPYHPVAADITYQVPVPFDRKPMPNLLLRAIRQLGLDPAKSLFIGDQETDRRASEAAGVNFLRFEGGDLYSAVRNCPDWNNVFEDF